MKKQKTVIMLEDIKENMLGEKHESLLDENKMPGKRRCETYREKKT